MNHTELRAKNLAQSFLHEQRNNHKYSPRNGSDILELIVDELDENEKITAQFKVTFNKGEDILEQPIWLFDKVEQIKFTMSIVI